MLETFGDRETLVVFDGGLSALAFNALHVKRITASELWLGERPIPLGALLGVGAGALDPRTRVLELETDEESVPVLARGMMSLRTVSSLAVQHFVKPSALDQDVAACVRGVVVGECGGRPTYLVDPSGLTELFRRHSSAPPSRST
jgi:hypothetical protein